MDEQVGYECFPTNNFHGTDQDKVIVEKRFKVKC